VNKRTIATDVVVVGAGAAGLAAANTLRANGYSVQLLEAKNRVGGRAWTDRETFGFPVDWGCHWLHSASINSFREMADAWSIEYKKTPADWRIYRDDHWETDDEITQWKIYRDKCSKALADAHSQRIDIPLADVLPPDRKWKPIYLYVMQSYTTASPERLSIMDIGNYNDTNEDWPVKNGYGALVARYSQDIDVHLNTTVTKISCKNTGAVVTTYYGELKTRVVIVTIPTNVLTANAIEFDPALPDWKLFAASQLPLGHGGKVAFKVDPVSSLPLHKYIVYGPSIPEAIGFQVQPFDFNLVIGHFGGMWCIDFKGISSPDAIEYARRELVQMYGSSVIKHITTSKSVMWHNDPHIQGTYSNALPGQSSQREALARPVDDRLYFAGEATSKDAYATAHGAYQSGLDAAKAVITFLGNENSSR